jgi:hypothetical protein
MEFQPIAPSGSLSIDDCSEESVMDDFFSHLPTLKQQLKLDSDSDATRLIDVVSFLHSMKSLLRISSQNYTLDYFNEEILGNSLKKEDSSVGHSSHESGEILSSTQPPVAIEDNSKSSDQMEIVTEEPSSGMAMVAMDKSNEEEEEAEFEESSVVQKRLPSTSQRDEVELDRIQLNLIRVVLDDLHCLFGLQDKDEKKQTSSFPHFPLNQLTWPEIARMIIIASLGKDIMRTDDEVSFSSLISCSLFF